MPELPEVETTINSLNKTVKGLRILDVWSNYNSKYHIGKNNIKDKKYFSSFIKTITGQKIISARRIAKNILIDLGNDITILVHMKMTGHFLYGNFEKVGGLWKASDKGPLQDPMNRFVRMVFTLSNGQFLAFSDMRRFAKVCYFPTETWREFGDLKNIGPDPMQKNLTLKLFKERLLKKPYGKIKQVIMDQEIIAGIGNIYSDEILWASGIHPLSNPLKIPESKFKAAFSAMKKILKKAIESGGDSMSDFRHLDGRKGGYQNFHKAYRLTGTKCSFPLCNGQITKIKLGGRSAHFCAIHQIKFQ